MPPPLPDGITFFKSRAEFRRWLKKHHAGETALWVGIYKKGSGLGGLTYPEAVEEALCFGWIDGHLKSIDEISYCQRFSPRKPGSIWSKINIAKMEALLKETPDKVQPAGLAAYEKRTAERSGIYSHEQDTPHELSAAYRKQFRANPPAWKYFQAQRPSYQRVAIHWVMAAKREETRDRRLAQLIEDSENGRRLKHLLG